MIATIEQQEAINPIDHQTLLRITDAYVIEAPVYDFHIPSLELYSPAIIKDNEFRGEDFRQTQFVKLLTLLPDGMGILRTSLSDVIYHQPSRRGSFNWDRFKLNHQLARFNLEIYNPLPHSNPVNQLEARYSLKEIDKPVKINNFLPEVSLQQLVQQAISRDDEAFASLYDLYQKQVLLYLNFRTRDSGLAEDLTLEVFIKAWSHIDRFQYREVPFNHWLIKIAKNLLIDHFRASHKPTISTDLLWHLEDDGKLPEEQVSKSLEIETLWRCFKSLNKNQRNVLVLRFIQGYSHADVATALGKSEQAVRQIQVRGLRALRKMMTISEDYRPD